MRGLTKFKKPKGTRVLGGALGLLLALSLVLIPASTSAIPQSGHYFRGNVTSDGERAAPGISVVAKVGELEYSTTVDAHGRYGDDPVLKVAADDPDTPGIEGASPGDPVEFYVSDVKASLYDVEAGGEWLETYPFEIGGLTGLNLRVGEELEYGDAPDPTYPSLLASDGARHSSTYYTEFLGLQSTGDGKDFEFDANVADPDLLDDGLVITTITEGNPLETVTFEVTDFDAPSSDLRVNILIDLNGNGDWADAGEHVVQNQQIITSTTAGEVFVSNPFPTVGATPGPTWLRITLTRHEIQNPPWDGTMAEHALMTPFECGETEDWAITIEPVGALSASEGPNTPSDHGWYWDLTADSYNEMLQIALTADPTEDIILNSVTLQASGTGNDLTGIAFVDLVVDSNNNGFVDDPSELPPKATGTYPSNNGALTLTILGGYTVTKETTEYFIIDYQMNSSPSVGDTFITTVTAISAVGASSGLPITVSGLPITSATKATVIQKFTLTVTSDGCCPIDVVYDGFSGSVAAGGSETFTGIPCCTNVTLTADDSDPCCVFDYWTGNVTGAPNNTNPITIHMDGHKNVTATCSTPGPFTLTVTSNGCCPIDVVYEGFSSGVAAGGSENFTGIPCCTNVTLTADDSDPCCEFTGWSGDVPSGHESDNPLIIHIDGDKSVTATCTVVPAYFTTTLLAGWNLLSTPILLDADSDSLGQIFDAASLSNIDVSYGWNGVNWVGLTSDYELSPLYAIYVKVKLDTSATATFIPSSEISALPNRELPEGVALIGPAPAFDSATGDFPDMALEDALVTINGNYTIVVSPGLKQPGWAYPPAGEGKDLLPYKGYWVVMENADTLFGFSTTPIS